jgi:hypothetical protein
MLAAATLIGCTGSGDDPALRSRCADARDHLIEARLDLAPIPDDQTEAHAAAMDAVAGRAYVDRCVTRGSHYADCVLAAGDLDSIRLCDGVTR